MSEPSNREIIELEVKRAVSGEVEAYRKTLEAHQAFIEKGTKYFAMAVSMLAALAGAAFVYFFQHSVKEAVRETIDKSAILDATNAQVTNKISTFTSDEITKALTKIDNATIAHVEEIKSTTLRKQVANALANFPTDQLTNLTKSVPAGTIAAFGGTNISTEMGWLMCDGSEKSQRQYPELYKAIGTSWGKGVSADAFKLPDLRGVFLRGVNGDRNDQFADPSAAARISSSDGNSKNAVGSFQPDEVGPHNHAITAWNSKALNNGGTIARTFDHDTPAEIRTVNNDGNETRPKNAYVYYIIKY